MTWTLFVRLCFPSVLGQGDYKGQACSWLCIPFSRQQAFLLQGLAVGSSAVRLVAAASKARRVGGLAEADPATTAAPTTDPSDPGAGEDASVPQT